MPFGPSVLGVAYFSGVKLVGYSAAGRYLNREAGVTHPSPLAFGATRTALGVVAGVSYAFVLSQVSITNTELAFYAGLVPVRVLEWLAVLWLFYRGLPQLAPRRTRYVALGIAWSYLLDLPAILAAFVIPGGFWVC